MTLATLIPLLLKGSLFIAVFAVGLTATLRDATLLFRQPGQLVRMVLSMNVVMFAVAIGASFAFDLDPVTKLALVTLSVSPVMPLFTGKASKAGIQSHYSIGVLVAASVLAIALVPLSIEICERVFDTSAVMPAAAVLKLVATSVLAPLAAGMLVRRLVPATSRFARITGIVAMGTLLLAFVPVMVKAWPSIVSLIRNGSVVPLVVFVVIGLAAGQLIGGPTEEERSVLAVAGACRHPGLAVAIAQANFPDAKLVFPAMILYALILSLVLAPYSKWSAKRLAAMPERVPKRASA